MFVTEQLVRNRRESGIMQWVLVLIGLLGTTGATVTGLYRGALAAGLPKRTATSVAAVAGSAWTAWMVVSAVLAASDVYRQSPDKLEPWIAVGVVVPFLVVVAASRIPVAQRILRAPGAAARLMWPQSFRVVGAPVLIAWALGELPAVFALPAAPAGVGVGVPAVFVA